MNPFSIDRESYFWAPLLTDVLVGCAAVVAIVAIAMPLGGFSFFQPWLIVTPLVLFSTGFLRGRSFGNAWGKAGAMNLPLVLLMVSSVSARTPLYTVITNLIAAPIAVACSVAGVWFRRRNG